VAGIFGLIIGLPALLYQLFFQTFSGRSPGKLGDLLPIGLLLSLAGYGLIRNDRLLQFVALALSLAFLAVAGVGGCQVCRRRRHLPSLPDPGDILCGLCLRRKKTQGTPTTGWTGIV